MFRRSGLPRFGANPDGPRDDGGVGRHASQQSLPASGDDRRTSADVQRGGRTVRPRELALRHHRAGTIVNSSKTNGLAQSTYPVTVQLPPWGTLSAASAVTWVSPASG